MQLIRFCDVRRESFHLPPTTFKESEPDCIEAGLFGAEGRAVSICNVYDTMARLPIF
jgi:hypothetical protein